MNETMYMPFMVLVIIGTALLSAVVTTALPHVPKWWNAFKSRIRRKSNATDIVDVILIAKLTERVDDLQEQVNNLAERLSTRDANRKSNTRREIRDYLEELRTK